MNNFMGSVSEISLRQLGLSFSRHFLLGKGSDYARCETVIMILSIY